MSQILRIILTEYDDDLRVECEGPVGHMMPALTMGAVEMVRVIAEQSGRSVDEAAALFVGGFLAVMKRPPDNRIDLSLLAKALRDTKGKPPEQS